MLTQSNSRGAGRQVPSTVKLTVVAQKWLLPCEKVGVVAKTSLSWRQVLRGLDLKAAPNGPNGVKLVSVHGYHPSFVSKSGPGRCFALNETVGDLIRAIENGSTAKSNLSSTTKYKVRICVKNRSRGKENNFRLARAAANSFSDSEALEVEKQMTPFDTNPQVVMETDYGTAFPGTGRFENPFSDNNVASQQEQQSCSSNRDTENNPHTENVPLETLPSLFPVIDLSSDSEEEDSNEDANSLRSPMFPPSTSDSGPWADDEIPPNFSREIQSEDDPEDVDLTDVEEFDWGGHNNYHCYPPAASICTTASEEEFLLRADGIPVENMDDLAQERLRSFSNAHKLKVKNELMKLRNRNPARWNRFFAHAPLAVNLLETVFKI